MFHAAIHPRARCRHKLFATIVFWAFGVAAGCQSEEPAYRLPEFQRFMQGYEQRVATPRLPSSPISTASDPSTQPTTRPSTLTLDGAIAECLQNNFAIRSSGEDVRQALADVWTSSLLPNPQVTLDTVLQTFNRSNLSAANPSGPPEYDAVVQFPIDWLLFGKRDAGIAVARHAANAAAATRADQIRQQVTATISSFYDVLQAKAMLALDEEDLHQNERLLDITALRVKAGGVGNVELDRVRVQLITARQTVDQDQRAIVVAKATLRALLGRVQPDQSFDVVGTLELPQHVPHLQLGELINRAKVTRPDLVALEYKLSEAEADVWNQEAQGMPQVALSAGYSLQEQVPVGLRNTSLWSASVQATVPIFNWNQGNIRKAKSARLQAMINYQGGLAQANANIEQALDAFSAAHRILVENGATLVDSARSARDKLQRGYQLGGYALVDALDADAAYRSALRQDLALRVDYWRSLHALNAAVGTQVLP